MSSKSVLVTSCVSVGVLGGREGGLFQSQRDTPRANPTPNATTINSRKSHNLLVMKFSSAAPYYKANGARVRACKVSGLTLRTKPQPFLLMTAHIIAAKGVEALSLIG